MKQGIISLAQRMLGACLRAGSLPEQAFEVQDDGDGNHTLHLEGGEVSIVETEAGGARAYSVMIVHHLVNVSRWEPDDTELEEVMVTAWLPEAVQEVVIQIIRSRLANALDGLDD